MVKQNISPRTPEDDVILPAEHDETNHLDCNTGVGQESLHLGGDIGNVPRHGRHPGTDTDLLTLGLSSVH